AHGGLLWVYHAVTRRPKADAGDDCCFKVSLLGPLAFARLTVAGPLGRLDFKLGAQRAADTGLLAGAFLAYGVDPGPAVCNLLLQLGVGDAFRFVLPPFPVSGFGVPVPRLAVSLHRR